MASPNPNPPPTWATHDQDDPPPPTRMQHSSADVEDGLDAAAASSVVGSSPAKSTHADEKMDVDEQDDDDAEMRRNRAAEALSDLAHVAVISASTAAAATNDTSARTMAFHPPPPVPDTAAAKQKRRPAALLTPTRRSGPSQNQHLSPNPSGAGSSSSRKSPLATPVDVASAGAKSDGSGQDQNAISLISHTNGVRSPIYPESPNRVDRIVMEKKGPYNSPFTNTPFVAGAHDQASGVPTINTGTRKDVPTYHVLRKEDGEMCTRADLQYDFLHRLFTNPVRAFSVPPFQEVPRKYDPATRPKLTFSELYCYTLASSKRSTKQLKEALLDLEPGSIPGKHQAGKAYRTRKRGELSKGGTDSVNASPGVETQMDELKEDLDELGGNGESTTADGYDGLRDGYAKICLLVNVGRINTTFAFYPAMRTVLRTYHSVPSLQKTQATRKSLQDAPRMKNALKAIRVSTEPAELPTSLEVVQERLHAGEIPPTSVVNLLFLLGLGHDVVTERFFDQDNIVDPHQLLAARASAQPGSTNETGKLHLLHLFTLINISSEERARMLLYILYHYLESDTGPNPFADPNQPDRPPTLHILSDEEYASLNENVDEPDELEWGAEMRARRIESLKELALQKQSAANTPGPSLAYTTASAATSARNSIEPSVFAYRSGLADSMDVNSDRHSDVGTDISSRKRKRYSPLGPEAPATANVTSRVVSADPASKQISRPPSPEQPRSAYTPHDSAAFLSRSARASPQAHHPEARFDPRFPSRSQSQTRSRVSPHVIPAGADQLDGSGSGSEDGEPPAVIMGRRDRNDPRAMQDDWAHGVDISGLDEETVRHLIYQVNLEFGDPPTPEPEIIWKEYERGPNTFEEHRRAQDEEYFRREDNRRRSYGNGLVEGRTVISPPHDNKSLVDDMQALQSSQSPAFSQRDSHHDRHPSINTSHLSVADRLPTSPPTRKTNSLSALLN